MQGEDDDSDSDGPRETPEQRIARLALARSQAMDKLVELRSVDEVAAM